MRVILTTLLLTGVAAASLCGPALPAASEVCKAGACRSDSRPADMAVTAEPRGATSYADMAKGWSPARREALARLLVAEAAFAEALGANETDRGSAGYGTDAVVAREAEEAAFARTLQAVVGGTTRLSFVEFAESDSALNAAYAQVMAVPDPSDLAWGSVDKTGIQRTQRAWLAYRDAFVVFAATISPDAAAAVKGELTTRRTVSLEGFLED